jgi:hypothetical protein
MSNADSTPSLPDNALVDHPDVERATHFTHTYRVRSPELHQSPRVVDVQASREEMRRLEADGYLVRERLIPPALLDELRAAADAIEAQELRTRQAGQGDFGGLFTRNIVDRHPTFLKLLNYAPLLSVARSQMMWSPNPRPGSVPSNSVNAA